MLYCCLSTLKRASVGQEGLRSPWLDRALGVCSWRALATGLARTEVGEPHLATNALRPLHQGVVSGARTSALANNLYYGIRRIPEEPIKRANQKPGQLGHFNLAIGNPGNARRSFRGKTSSSDHKLCAARRKKVMFNTAPSPSFAMAKRRKPRMTLTIVARTNIPSQKKTGTQKNNLTKRNKRSRNRS